MEGAAYRPLVQQIALWRRMLVQHGGVGIIACCFLVDGRNVVKLRSHITARIGQQFVLYSPTLR